MLHNGLYEQIINKGLDSELSVRDNQYINLLMQSFLEIPVMRYTFLAKKAIPLMKLLENADL